MNILAFDTKKLFTFETSCYIIYSYNIDLFNILTNDPKYTKYYKKTEKSFCNLQFNLKKHERYVHSHNEKFINIKKIPYGCSIHKNIYIYMVDQ